MILLSYTHPTTKARLAIVPESMPGKFRLVWIYPNQKQEVIARWFDSIEEAEQHAKLLSRVYDYHNT